MTISVLGVVTLLAAGIAARNGLVEGWYLWRMDSRDFTVRFEAARKLGRMGSARAIPKIVVLLKDSDGHNGEANQLVDVFRGMGPPAVPLLAQALKDSNGEKKYWRRCAFQALVQAGAREAIPPLIDRLEDGYLCLRLAAFFALGEMGPEAREAIPALTTALQDQNHNVRSAAERALEKIQGNSR